jgi:NhaP-type Na+/H+ and K+/H+ antiporter
LKHVVLLPLLAAAVMLPIAVCVLVGLGRLLGGMGDAAGSLVLERIGLALGIAWILDLVFLLLWLAIQRLLESGDPPEEP